MEPHNDTAPPSGYDPRVHAYRDDLADRALDGLVKAERYAEGEMQTIASGFADLRSAPDASAQRTSQALRGEMVRVFDVSDGWAWLQLQTDGYVGYMPLSGLEMGDETRAATHVVTVTSSFVYPEPDIKSPNAEHISYGEKFSVTGEEGAFFKTHDDRYIYSSHLRSVNTHATNVIAESEKFLGVPYLWGGRSAFGIDCSALVQLACSSAGISAPRDSDMQEAYLGRPLDHMDHSELKATDLVFWKGHVGIMVDDINLLHSNGHHMQVVIEPIAEAITRIAYIYAEPTSFRRLIG